MIAAVEAAIAEIRDTFPGHQVDVTAVGDGGAHVMVHGLPLPDRYTQGTTWVAFTIVFQYPYADVYPHFIDAAVQRKDGQPLGDGFSAGNWQGQACTQISRRSNRHDAEVDTAAMKLAKVLEWVQSL